jgi:hypothetical protein
MLAVALRVALEPERGDACGGHGTLRQPPDDTLICTIRALALIATILPADLDASRLDPDRGHRDERR